MRDFELPVPWSKTQLEGMVEGEVWGWPSGETKLPPQREDLSKMVIKIGRHLIIHSCSFALILSDQFISDTQPNPNAP